MPRRSINTDMWSDDRFDELSAPAKLVFLRLTTGPDTNSCGALRLSAKRVAVDCSLTRGEVEKAVDELAAADLIRRFDDGWVWMPAWIKHQVSGPGFIGASRRAAKGLPASLTRAVSRELDRLFPRKNAVDNSPDEPGPSKDTKTRTRQASDAPQTKNNATSGDDWGLTPQETPRQTGGETGGPSCFRERGSVPEPVPAPGLTYGQSVLVHGQGDTAPPSAAAGPPPALSREDQGCLAEIVSLTMARSAADPDPDREAERERVRQEIEDRRRLRDEATA